MGWEPDRYLQFADERLRPALDLLGQVALSAPGRIVDLGCGPGNVTGLLATRWPMAQITGLDSSPEMLARAQAALPALRFELGGVEEWMPDAPLDLLFSNAALHWLGAHEALFPRLLDSLAPGGVLAVQMPANFAAPSHRLIRELAAEPAWAARLGAARMGAVLGLADYHRILAPLASRLSLWETIYWQALRGPAPVLDWLKGTTLLPYLVLLDAASRAAFLDALGPRLLEAYPSSSDGITLFPFRRFFILAQR